jgi:glutaredoxin
MKKILALSILSLFILGAVTVPAFQDNATPTTQPQPTGRDYTHAVFAEQATATWCGYCHYAREALQAIYDSHDFPFYYVGLVDDKNTHAHDRITEYNIYGFPTVYFDAGFNVQVGASSEAQAEAAYRNVIPTAGARTVADLNASLDVTWLDNCNMNITVSITNNMSTTYVGKLKVYVAEMSSSLGWHDTTGHPYTMAFLDYAQNQAVTIAGGETWTNTYTWIGANHDDGHGNKYAVLDDANIEIVAAVYNNTWHQSYSYPPNQYPFHAFYPDEVIGYNTSSPVQQPPVVPYDPSPADGGLGVKLNKDLGWSCGDPEQSTVHYDVYFGTTNPPPLVSTDQTAKTYDTGNMIENTTYYWKINASDGSLTSESPVWSFTTVMNHAPAAPSSPSPTNGQTNVPINRDLSWSCTDPDGDTLHYDVYFGTTSPPPLVSSQQTAKTYDTGNMLYNTTYYWKINATDSRLTNESPLWTFTTGKESDVTPPSLTITKPLAGYIYKNDAQLRKRIFFSNALILKQITITVNASDANGISKIEFYIDSALKSTATTTPYAYLWDTSSGLFHTIKIIAYDASSNPTTKSISVTRLG